MTQQIKNSETICAYGLYLSFSEADVKGFIDILDRTQADIKAEIVVRFGNVKKEMTFKEFFAAFDIETPEIKATPK